MKSKLANIESNNGRFIDGNPATGTLGTIVTAKFLNDVQDRLQDTYEEIKGVLDLANIPLDVTRQDQLAVAIRELLSKKQTTAVRHRIDLSALEADKYYLVSLIPTNAMMDGRRWQFEVRRPLYFGGNRVPWATHRDGGFSLQAVWSSNADGWGANRSYRTIEAFEFHWTNQSPLLRIEQIGQASIEFCYLRGGSAYDVYAPEGFVVQHHTAELTRNGSSRPSPIDYDVALLPKVDVKLIRELYPEAVRHKSLTDFMPNSTTQRWQSALPNELPFGTVMGFTQRAILNTNTDVYSGWGMVSRGSSSDATKSVRFGVNYGKFYVQQAKNETEWGEASEVMMARTLTTENLNDVLGVGVYKQADTTQSTAARNYPEVQGGTLWVSPAADGVLQEYTASTGNKWQRLKNGSRWGAWKRIDPEQAYQTGGYVFENTNTLFGSNRTWGTNGTNHATLGFPSSMYNYGSGLSIGVGNNESLIYIPHSNANNNGVWWMSRYRGSSAVPTWRRIDGADWAEVRGKPELVLKAGDTMTGVLKSGHKGFGEWRQQYKTEAPFFIDAVDDVRRNTYHPFVKGKMRRHNEYGASFSFGWTSHLGEGDNFGKGTVLFSGDNAETIADQVRKWFFETNGDFVAADGDVRNAAGRSLNDTIRRIGNPHDIQLAWLNDGLNLKVDTTELGLMLTKRNLPSQVARTTKTRTANHPQRANESYTTNGSVTIYPDGRIVQIFHLVAIRPTWFDLEAEGVGLNGSRHRNIHIQLWTAMPNKIEKVHAQLMTATSGNTTTYRHEAAEWSTAWQLRNNAHERNWVNINAARVSGGEDEPVDLYVVVEGY